MREICWNHSGVAFWWLVVISSSVLLFLIIVEFRKKRKQRLSLRITLLVFMIASLTLMVLNPSTKSLKNNVSGILLTEDYDFTILDSIRNTLTGDIITFSTDIKVEGDITPVTSIEEVAYVYPEIDTLFILGNGLNDWNENVRLPFKIIPLFNETPAGIFDIFIPEEVGINEPIEIKGSIKNTTDSLISLLLTGPDGATDSISVPIGISSFILKDQPKIAGKFIYTLIENRIAEKEIIKHPIPIIIKSFVPLNIAIYANAPSFEIKFLKNWLGSLGHNVAVRSEISKNIFNQEIINQASSSYLQFSEGALKELDLFIIEGEVLSGLNNPKLQVLENALAQNELGLLILGDQSIINNINSRKLKFLEDFGFTSDQEDKVIFEKEIKGKNIQGEIEKMPIEIIKNPRVKSLHNNLFAIRNSGVGKIGFSLATETYTLNLSGKNDLYSYFWSEILKETLPENVYDPTFDLDQELYFENHKLHLDLLNYHEFPVIVIKDNEGVEFSVHPIQNPNFSDRWSGVFLPFKTGWHQIKLLSPATNPYENEIEKWFYVQVDSLWSTYNTNVTINKSKELSLHLSADYANISPVYTYHKIDRIYFFAIFLLSCGLLWVEQKL